jgi:hypothetical protein
MGEWTMAAASLGGALNGLGDEPLGVPERRINVEPALATGAPSGIKSRSNFRVVWKILG